jgi:hypothetical protein
MEQHLRTLIAKVDSRFSRWAVGLLLLAWICLEIIGQLGEGIAHSRGLVNFSNKHLGRETTNYILIAIVVAAVGLIGFSLGRMRRASVPDSDTSSRLIEAVRLNDVDYQIFLILEQLAVGGDGTLAASRAVEDVLENIVRYFGNEIVRATIYRPTQSALTAWVGFEMPQDSLRMAVFPYLPKPGVAKGEVLAAWETGKIRFNGCKEKSGKRVFPSEDYRASARNPNNRPYRSFACVPFQSRPRNEIGAVCFDSQSASFFAPKGRRKQELENALSALAVRLSSIVAVSSSLVGDNLGEVVDEKRSPVSL